MKRVIGFTLFILACIVAFISVKGILPLVPVFDSSMEPSLRSGGLLLIKSIRSEDIRVGDIIVYNVTPLIRDYYAYPPTISHRVTKILTEPSLGFRTKSDNAGEDPFTVRPMDIRGTVGKQIPYLGLPLLFFQSQQGLFVIIVALVLLALVLYRREIRRIGISLYRGIFSPVLNEEKQVNRALSRKIEFTGKKMDSTEQALLQFSSAIADYARHLASHTSAIQGLSQASHELKRGAAEQNRVLSAIMNNMEKPGRSQGPSALMKEIPMITQQLIPSMDKPTGTKTPPFHGALYKVTPEITAHKYKSVIVVAEKPASVPVPPEVTIKKLTPVADKLVINARKSVQRKENPAKIKDFHTHYSNEKPIPPGCAREHQESLWR